MQSDAALDVEGVPSSLAQRRKAAHHQLSFIMAQLPDTPQIPSACSEVATILAKRPESGNHG